MPITPTYPGIYIEELPSSAHTVTAAPTSITVFVGYTHPFKTKNFNQAVELFSFTDYEREFGGFLQSDVIDTNVAYAVNMFFLNGGSHAYVIGLKPQHYLDNGGNQRGAVVAAQLKIGGIQFTSLEPTDKLSIGVTIGNLQKTANANDTADITLAYGSRSETFRKVTLVANHSDPNFIANRLNGISQLVSIDPTQVFPAAFTAVSNQALAAAPPAGATTVFEATDFMGVFAQDSSLDKLPIFNLVVLPGIIDNSVLSEALAFCERKRAFLIMDPPEIDVADAGANWIGGFMSGGDTAGNVAPLSTNGALYFPYLKSTDPSTGKSMDPATRKVFELPPSGAVAGIFAREDVNRGVWKAPAGLETTVHNTTGVVDRGRMTDDRQGTLNPLGVNCLRDFPGIGTVVFGARTLVTNNSAFEQWRYVPVRRMALFLEQSLYNSLGWAVFEPNDRPLWTALRVTVENFMLSFFRQGAFQGDTPSKAFLVKCDDQTTTQTDIDKGIVNIIVGFAPLKPAEFVIIKISQLAGQTQS